MDIKYFGTAAAEGLPAIFCNCDTCKRALAKGGRNIMTRSQALINGELLVDFNADTYMHLLREGLTLANIGHVLITHSHEDHLVFNELAMRTKGFAYDAKYEKLTFYLSTVAYDKTRDFIKWYLYDCIDKIAEKYSFVILQPYKEIHFEGYTVTPFPARHGEEDDAFVFLIEKDGKALFYGNDTGYFNEDIDEYLAKNGKKINLLSLDCTKGDREQDYYAHMSMSEGRKIADRFYARGVIDDSTILYYTHVSHNCGMTYDELFEAAKKYGFSFTHDGLKVEF